MERLELKIDEAMMRLLQKEKNFQKEPFNIDMPLENLADMLFTCYTKEVMDRNRKLIRNEILDNLIMSISRVLSTKSHRFGMVLTGTCGIGKTTMLRAIRDLIHMIYMSNYQCSHKIRLYDSNIAIFSAKEIIERIMTGKSDCLYRDFLMIDDLGHEPTEVMNYGMVYTPLVDLIEKRYDNQKYTFISTNLSINQFRPKYGNRIADRLNEMMWIIPFEGESYRIVN